MDKKELLCPRCGTKNNKPEQKGGLAATFIICKNCGYRALPSVWEHNQRDRSVIAENSIADNSQISRQPSPENNPDNYNAKDKRRKQEKSRKVYREYNPEDKYDKHDPNEVRRAKMNPFYKKSQLSGNEDKNLMTCPACEGSGKDETGNPFFKANRCECCDGKGVCTEEEAIYFENKRNDLIGVDGRGQSLESYTNKKNPFYKKAAWDINMSDEGWDNVRENLEKMDKNFLAEAVVTCETYDEGKDISEEKFYRLVKEKIKLPSDILENLCFDFIQENNTATNGGHQVYIDKQGFYKIPVDKLEEEKMTSSANKNNPFYKKSKKNPFLKEAREYQRSEWGQFMKELSEKNMAFPEGRQDKEKKEDKDKSSKKQNKSRPMAGDPYDDVEDNAFVPPFNIIDRKEYRSSPDPKKLIPGYKEWFERNVDQYYDGWVDDHIRNSGGSIPGSNTEKIMNLDDNERNHPPVYPTEAIYEKLLESRHDFNEDYEKVVAKGKTYLIKKSEAEEIRKISKFFNKKKENDVDLVEITESIKEHLKSLGIKQGTEEYRQKFKELVDILAKNPRKKEDFSGISNLPEFVGVGAECGDLDISTASSEKKKLNAKHAQRKHSKLLVHTVPI